MTSFGVVEGFYNRPWSEAQRLDLFRKLKQFGLNSYLYAPKDDTKHRSDWRIPYTTEELESLRRLIDGCNECDVVFYYGISPGLDIRYSDESGDISTLKSKLDQLKDIGCRGYAVLWDDIEPIFNHEVDKLEFTTLEAAHVRVTNTIYEYMGSPEGRFFICPTEYCASRSGSTTPTATSKDPRHSKYLTELGKGLKAGINVFWTGSTVVPEQILKEELEIIAETLKRKPVLWDNLHANDYDSRRIFMGPYDGRDPEILSCISGVFANPNCEYSANVVPLSTLGQWSKKKDGGYDPIEAARIAIPEFLNEMSRPTSTTTPVTESSKLSEITEREAETLIQFFWLPYSHGPEVRDVCKEFEYLRDHVHIVKAYENDDNDDDDDGDNNQKSFIPDWIERASKINDLCVIFSRLSEKFCVIKNREMFFDLNPYLNDVEIVLSGCNRYLKWVGLNRCKRPFAKGPTLAGLPGGFAGDLERLYPIQNQLEYPVQRCHASIDKRVLLIRPVFDKSELAEFLIPIFPSDPSERRSILAGVDEFIAYGAEFDGQLVSLVVGWKDLKSLTGKGRLENSWMDNDCDVVMTFNVKSNKFLFSDGLTSMLTSFLHHLKKVTLTDASKSVVVVIVVIDKSDILSKQFLCERGCFEKIKVTDKLCILRRKLFIRIE